jgi:hypothetical protein
LPVAEQIGRRIGHRRHVAKLSTSASHRILASDFRPGLPAPANRQFRPAG